MRDEHRKVCVASGNDVVDKPASAEKSAAESLIPKFMEMQEISCLKLFSMTATSQ